MGMVWVEIDDGADLGYGAAVYKNFGDQVEGRRFGFGCKIMSARYWSS